METVLPVLEDGLQARFLFLPEGEDPDSLVRKEGKPAFEERLNNAIHLPEFLFQHLKEQVDFDTLDGKARLDQLAAPLINRLPKGMLRNLMKQKLNSELGTASVALEKLEQEPALPAPASHSGIPASEPSPGLHDTEAALPPLQDHSADTLAPLVYKALCSLVRRPALATQLELPDTEAESEQERLLLEVLKKLHQNPQSSSVGLLIQWIGSPYQHELQRIAELPDQGIPPAANDIAEALKQMNARQLSVAVQRYTQRIGRGEKLSAAERSDWKDKQRQLHDIQKKRARIYTRHPDISG